MDSEITRYFTGKVFSALSAVKKDKVFEIRLRTDRALSLVTENGILYLTESGELTSDAKCAVNVSFDDMRRIFDSLCRYSIHSNAANIRECFVTVTGGHRAGICGTAVYNGERVETVRDISGINFRVARECIGAADRIMKECMKNSPKSVLVCGEPSSGKTTVLRDLCRQLGNRYSVSLIDERSEIAASVKGKNCNDVGINTDVFNGFTKCSGIISALRVMSPTFIVCDEIGTDEDISAVKNAFGCGVRIAASVHAGSPEDIFGRKNISCLCKAGYFEYAAFVKNGNLEKIIKLGEKNENNRNNHGDTDSHIGGSGNV